MENTRVGWMVPHGSEKMGRICHRFEILMPFDEDQFWMYIKDKQVTKKTFRRQVCSACCAQVAGTNLESRGLSGT
jgi:hypothetical protein